jgi:hypothetical protein
MKNIVRMSVILALSAFLTNCAEPSTMLDDSTTTARQEKISTVTKAPTITIQEPSSVVVDTPVVTTDDSEAMDAASRAPAALPAPEFLAGVNDVEPWKANYVGSYDVLPTRYGEAPFFYSFTVSPYDIFPGYYRDGWRHRAHRNR